MEGLRGSVESIRLIGDQKKALRAEQVRFSNAISEVRDFSPGGQSQIWKETTEWMDVGISLLDFLKRCLPFDHSIHRIMLEKHEAGELTLPVQGPLKLLHVLDLIELDAERRVGNEMELLEICEEGLQILLRMSGERLGLKY